MNATVSLTVIIGILTLSLITLIAYLGAKMSRRYYGLLYKQIEESSQSLNKNIIDSVQTKFVEISPSAQSFVDMAVEV